MPYGILALQGLALVLLAGLIFARESAWVQWVGTNALLFGLLATLGAVLGSLFYSNVLGYEPCYLCWWQRTFMYPQLIIFAIAYYYKQTNAFRYSLALSILGTLVSLYHNFLPYFQSLGLDCGSTGPACDKLYVLAFGYITIPVMSLSVFVILILLAVASRSVRLNTQSSNL